MWHVTGCGAPVRGAPTFEAANGTLLPEACDVAAVLEAVASVAAGRAALEGARRRIGPKGARQLVGTAYRRHCGKEHRKISAHCRRATRWKEDRGGGGEGGSRRGSDGGR